MSNKIWFERAGVFTLGLICGSVATYFAVKHFTKQEEQQNEPEEKPEPIVQNRVIGYYYDDEAKARAEEFAKKLREEKEKMMKDLNDEEKLPDEDVEPVLEEEELDDEDEEQDSDEELSEPEFAQVLRERRAEGCEWEEVDEEEFTYFWDQLDLDEMTYYAKDGFLILETDESIVPNVDEVLGKGAEEFMKQCVGIDLFIVNYKTYSRYHVDILNASYTNDVLYEELENMYDKEQKKPVGKMPKDDD